MTVNMTEVEQMVENINEIDLKAADAYNKLCTIGLDTGLIENPEFAESLQTLIECVFSLRDLNLASGIESCKAKAVVENVKNQSLVGKYLVEQAIKEEE